MSPEGCDMAHTPLRMARLTSPSSLSLMGRNWPEYLEEARRVLKPYGFLFVAEPAGRWEEEYLGGAITEHGFDVNRSEQRGKFRYVRAVKVD